MIKTLQDLLHTELINIGCVFHFIEASKTREAVLPQLLMGTKQIPKISVGLK